MTYYFALDGRAFLQSFLAAAALAVCIFGTAFPAEAQETEFLAAVRELATNPRGTPAAGRLKAALAEWDRQIRMLEAAPRPAGNAAFEHHVALGIAYRRRGRSDQALKQFDAAAALRSEASDVHLLRGLTLQMFAPRSQKSGAGSGRVNRFEEAGNAFHAAWRRDAANPIKAYLAFRFGNLALSDRARAMNVLGQSLHRLIAADSRSTPTPFLSIDPIPDAFSRAPIVGTGALAGVFAHLAAGRFDDAVADLAAAGAAPPAGNGDKLPALERGRIAETEGRYRDAAREYTAALDATLAGRHALLVGIGRLLQVQGDFDGSIDAFTDAVRLSPNDPIIRRELAAAYVGAGRTDDALAELVAALLIAPRHTEVLADIAQLQLDTERPADAIPILQRLLAIDANRYQTHYSLAVALSRTGRTEEAAREFQRFERLNADALDARRRSVTGEAGPPPPSRGEPR